MADEALIARYCCCPVGRAGVADEGRPWLEMAVLLPLPLISLIVGKSEDLNVTNDSAGSSGIKWLKSNLREPSTMQAGAKSSDERGMTFRGIGAGVHSTPSMSTAWDFQDSDGCGFVLSPGSWLHHSKKCTGDGFFY